MNTPHNNRLHQQYRIVAECTIESTPIALAGFYAEEQTESTLFRHLHNLCVLSDGSLTTAHALLCKLMQQWQTSFSIPQMQLLNNITCCDQQSHVQAMCLYKTKNGEAEKLINRILL